jgi:hypothetical protein
MDLVVAVVVPDIVVAATLKTMLEQADIPVMLRSAGSVNWLVPGTPGGVGPLEVMVPEELLADARELIAELEDGEPADVEPA